jgi:hypothetical protein
LTVSRWRNSENNVPDPKNAVSGASFVDALRQLVSPWSDTQDVRAHFKVIRVDLQGPTAGTKVHVQLAGRAAAGYVQQNATWNCVWQRSPANEPPRLAEVRLEEFEEITSHNDAGVFLSDCTESVLGANASYQRQLRLGIDYWRDRLDWRLGLDVAGPHGLAVGDVNNDGLDDLFVCEPGGLPNRLFLQQPAGTALDVSEQSGVDWLEPATSALLVDIDNDGDQDLLFTSGRYLIACENDGKGHFSRRSVEQLPSVIYSIAAADFDLDGKLDVYACCYIARGVSLADVGMGKPMPYHDANNGPLPASRSGDHCTKSGSGAASGSKGSGAASRSKGSGAAFGTMDPGGACGSRRTGAAFGSRRPGPASR